MTTFTGAPFRAFSPDAKDPPRRVDADLARAEDRDRILELYWHTPSPGGTSVVRADPADFAWRRERNPDGTAVIPVVRDERGQVVGMIWLMPRAYRVHGRDVAGAVGQSLVIHREYRETFAYVKLLRRFDRALADHAIPLHVSFVSAPTYRRERARNPGMVSMVPLMLKMLDPSSLARTYFVSGWKRALASSAVRPFAMLPLRRRPATIRGSIRVEPMDGFGPDFDAFWETVKDRYRASAVRNRAFLAWRFAPVSGRRYHVLVARAEERMVGYAVLQCATIRRVPAGLVMDFRTADDATGEAAGALLLDAADAYFRGRGQAVAGGLMARSAAEYGSMRRAGYLPMPTRVAPRLFGSQRFAVFVHGRDDATLASLSATDWFVTTADYEFL